MRRRSSGTLPMLEKAERTDMAALASSLLELRAPDQDDLAARLLDLLGRALGEGVGGDGDRLGELPVAEDLDAIEAALHQAAGDEGLLVDVRAGGEHLEIADVDLGDDLGEG